jgi:hypothetical protein
MSFSGYRTAIKSLTEMYWGNNRDGDMLDIV